MRMKIKCIALDLDRTTLNSDGYMSQANRDALEAAIDAGIHIVVASGRSLDSLPEDILSIEGIRYAITSNGAAVYDIRSGECLRQYKLTADSVRAILRYTEKEEVSFEAFINGKPYAEARYVSDPVRFGAAPRAISYIQRTRTPVEDMKKFILDHSSELESIDVVVKGEELKERLWKTLKNYVADVYITSSVPQLLEISYRESGKDSGAKFLLDRLGLKREELAAFGDGDNDAGLLAFAGAGFAVANASEACRKAADQIVPSNDADGVAQGIRMILVQ